MLTPISIASGTRPIRTRFAPSPTGFLHLGGARTALFSWAFARHFGGAFILRIEDTDLARSTPEAVQAILEGMQWLNLDYDEGPFYQMQRIARYQEMIQQLVAKGNAYHCYSSPQELETMRLEAQRQGLKPRYDGTWRPEPEKKLPPIPTGVKPVIRFRNPVEGQVVWQDLIKGEIAIANAELDDLVIARPDGTPTYNFCVVVDDWDMRISHVIRGDDHINNTPRQINILKALGATIPEYGHVPMILGPDGDKLSKRHGAVSVMQYQEQGYLPEAMVNYLARLGWSHGDDEIFSRDQLVQWFDGSHLAKSPAQWDPKKLTWVNSHYLKNSTAQELVPEIKKRVQQRLKLSDTTQLADEILLTQIVTFLKDRAETLEHLAEQASLFYEEDTMIVIEPVLREQYINKNVIPALQAFTSQAANLVWSPENILGLIKSLLSEFSLKMPQLAIPLRVALTARTQTPPIDQMIHLLGQAKVIRRLEQVLEVS